MKELVHMVGNQLPKNQTRISPATRPSRVRDCPPELPHDKVARARSRARLPARVRALLAATLMPPILGIAHANNTRSLHGEEMVVVTPLKWDNHVCYFSRSEASPRVLLKYSHTECPRRKRPPNQIHWSRSRPVVSLVVLGTKQTAPPLLFTKKKKPFDIFNYVNKTINQ